MRYLVTVQCSVPQQITYSVEAATENEASLSALRRAKNFAEDFGSIAVEVLAVRESPTRDPEYRDGYIKKVL